MVGCTAAAPSLSSAVNKKKNMDDIRLHSERFCNYFQDFKSYLRKKMVDTKPFEIRFFLANFP